jgi:hypothetical protein
MTYYTAFLGHRKLLSGSLAEVALALRALPEGAMPLVFDDASGAVVDVDLSGSLAEMLARLAPPPGRGRPRLGVVAREVTLLPRHWDWLATQPGGASVTLRRLIEAARRDAKAEAKAARDAAYRFMAAVAGDLPGYEEALRALFAGDREAFTARLADWPADVRSHAMALADAGLT